MSPWLVVALVAGPPKLPPLPGRDAPAAEPPAGAPAKPSTTAKPSTPAKPVTPASKLPSQPAIAPAAPTPGAPPSPGPSPTPIPEAAAPPSTDVPAIPDAKGEPPQPSSTAPPPRPVREGPGAAPRMDGKTLPGEVDDDDDGRKRMPPPARPPSRGTDLFIGAGVMFSVALAEQIAGHVLVKRRCIDPVAKNSMMVDTPEGAEAFGDAIVRCLPGVVPAIALRVNSDLLLFGTIGMLAAGAMLRAQRKAYDDAFAQKRQRNIKALRGAGIGLVAGGVITWLTLGPTSWGLLSKCGTAKCATRARAMSFTTRDIGALLAASGAAMLGFAEAYRRRHDEYSRERAIMFAPQFGRGMAGLGMTGRF
jgi:hypothetical protein